MANSNLSKAKNAKNDEANCTNTVAEKQIASCSAMTLKKLINH
jgi:hypothetical protein